MVKVSLYARVSSRQQAQENTIESQIVELERRISSDGHELLDGIGLLIMVTVDQT